MCIFAGPPPSRSCHPPEADCCTYFAASMCCFAHSSLFLCVHPFFVSIQLKLFVTRRNSQPLQRADDPPGAGGVTVGVHNSAASNRSA